MRLITYIRNGNTLEEVGILLMSDKGQYVLPVDALGFSFDSMNELIVSADEEALSRMRQEALDAIKLIEAADVPAACISRDAVTLLSPIPHPLQDVLCLGLNYTEHASEAAAYSGEAFSGGREAPVFFSKRVSYSQGTDAIIPFHEDITSRLDYECELAVILGKDVVDVDREDTADYIFGYTVLNDVSARDLQTTHKQWYFGKSLDGFCPMGPCIVTTNEISFPPKLKISTTINGELRQDSTTDLLIHDIPEIISTLSKGMVLRAGTIIATGTPKGVAMGMESPVFLKAGDEVVCAIEGIGELVNVVQ